ncbi:Fibrillin-3 [Manis javanica]|nr:Fibrillin-3 [Manis javanica]
MAGPAEPLPTAQRLTPLPGSPFFCINPIGAFTCRCPSASSSTSRPALGSLASLDAEALLTCGLNLLCLGRAEHVLELQPVLESLGHCMRYVTAYGNERGFSHMHHFRGLSSLQLRHRRPEPGVYQLETWTLGQAHTHGRAESPRRTDRFGKDKLQPRAPRRTRVAA